MRKLLEHTMRIVGVAFILAAGTALPAYAAKDLDIRNDTNSFLFVSGTGGNVGIGTTVPVAKLSVVGTGTTTGKAFEIDDSLYAPKVTVLDNGNIGVGSTVPVTQLQVGVNPTIPAGSTPAVAIKSNLVVDGKIYGDGSGITNVPGSISGLNSGYLSRANTNTSIVDSGIYQNGGNIGLGTTVPASTLDLVGVGTTSATSNLTLRNANKSALVTVLDNGYVGIGTMSPGYNFDLVQSFTGSGTIFRVGNKTYSNAIFTVSSLTGEYGMAKVLTNGGTTAIQLSSNGDSYFNGGNLGIGTIAPASKLDLVGVGTTSATSNLILRDANKSALVTVLDNGNVGIGTTNPRQKLQLIGNFEVGAAGSGAKSYRFRTDGGALDFESSGADTYYSTWSSFDFGGTQNNYLRLDSGSHIASAWGNWNFISGNNVGSGNTVLSILGESGGNIGIGTSAPVAMLHVGATPPSGTADLSSNSALIKGNLEVDGKIYGDGTGITGITGTITGLNAGYLSRANASTSIVDSGIYQSGSNMGIGTTVPQAQLEIGTATTMVSGATPALAVKNDVVVDGNVYGNEYHLGANAVIKYNAATSSIDFVIN